MPNIQTAYQFVIDKCNDPNVGYSQDYRKEQTVNGKTYYDCSSLMWYALKNAGFDVIAAYEEVCWGFEPDRNPIVTGYLCNWLLALGFTEITISDEWKPGDILWRDGHTEMVYEGRTTMGAHTHRYAFENQVSINDSPSSVSSWSRCFRYGAGGSNTPVFEWIYGETDEYLSEEQMQNNAVLVYQFFSAKGWSMNAIAALLGNMEVESTLNPNMIEIGGTGHGLVQWTPPENLYAVLDVLYGSHSDWHLGEKQLEVLYAEYQEATGQADRGIEKQWYSTSNYPMSWSEWSTSDNAPSYLVLVFMHNYERPDLDYDNGHAADRIENANKWYEFLLAGDFTPGGGGITPDPPTPTVTIKKKKHYNFILFNRRKRGNQF